MSGSLSCSGVTHRHYDLADTQSSPTLSKKNPDRRDDGPSDFRKQLSVVLPEMAAAAYERSNHLAVLDAEGSLHPEPNYLDISLTFQKFKAEFLPLSPLIDPRGRQILIRRTNFPKFLNLRHKDENQQKRAHTILDEIEAGTFIEADYLFEKERLRSLFWIPDVIRNPTPSIERRRALELWRRKRCMSKSIESRMSVRP